MYRFIRLSRNPRWCCAPISAYPFTEARVNSALAQDDGFGQRSVNIGPPFGRRENGLDNWLGRYIWHNLVASEGAHGAQGAEVSTALKSVVAPSVA